ncbi:MAG: PAS domain S-box protein, partial [Chloroflexi bacterium]|nr:PAS domain S-box protein [Chloroflexota bacterium]
GPAATTMATLDRRLMTKLRYAPELILGTPDDIRVALEFEEDVPLSVPALLAIPLHSHERFQGILWLGYRQSSNFDLSERNLLHTFASQAAVLVENARLFATAEGGRRRLAAVLASTSDAVIVTDPTDRILLINPAMEHIFGLKAADVANRAVKSVIESKPLVESLTSDGDYTHNLEVPVNDGRIFYASISRIKNREGQIFGRVCVLRDITHLKEIDKMKSEFVSTVSHDLRNPLTFMRGYISMFSMVGEVNDKQNEYIDKIMNGIDQMSKLVDDLLDLSRIEAGIDFNQDEIELHPLLSDIAEQYWQHAHLAGIKLHVDVSPQNTKIRGDEQLIRQAITNLLGNAIKYAKDSGPMMLGASTKNGKVIISVKDNGPGIPEESQIRLFEKFYRVVSPGTEKIKGTGLGLAIVKTIAERHGGTARCHSKQGEGSTFFIELPSLTYTNGSTANGAKK